ncbi:hypothetical protein ACFL96_03245 [Thermoproteota archaeon]
MRIEVYSKSIEDDVFWNIVKKIKSRKGLENADDELVAEKIISQLKKNKKMLAKLSQEKDFSSIARSKDVEGIVKHVRAELRPVYGLFIEKDLGNIREIMKKKGNGLNKAGIRKILSMHVSSKERLGFYEDFYKKIFEITGKPKSMMDIACGLNPFSFYHMNLPKKTRYIALELNRNDAELINEFFRLEKINGRAKKHDLTAEPVKDRADVAFAFKIFDLVDNKITERMIKDLSVKWIVASFSTKTVSRKDMGFKRRAGFQKMLRRLGLEYQTITFTNEIVYLIMK